MSGPNDTDDGWAELARELGLEQPRPAPKAVEQPPPLPPEAVAEFERPAAARVAESSGWDDAPTEDFAGCLVESEDSAEEAEADGDEPDESEEGVEVAADGTGEPGEPKKKRRRRRRRRKKGPGEPGEAGEAADAPNGAEGEVESAEEESEEEDVTDPLQPVGEEAPSPEASRELIANWDVPSWETIIQTMLYRPGGR